MPDTAHTAIIDGRTASGVGPDLGETATDSTHNAVTAGRDRQPSRPYRNAAEALAAVTAWLQDGVDLVRRARVDKERQYFRDSLVELGLVALASYDEYRGEAFPTEVLHAQVEKIVGEAEAGS